MNIDIEKAQREEARWRILKVLDAGRPMPVSETIIFRCLCDINLPISPNGVRRELDYLEERTLLKVLGKDDGIWSAELTRTGVDVVEYTVPCEPGISRPKKA